MTVMTLNLVEKQPAAMRRIIGKHLAVPRWQETCGAFSKRRQVGASEYAYISFLTVSQRRTLFMHAGLTEKEFNQPYWRINEESCYWRDALFRALRELFSLFEYAPTILTSVKPEQYLH